MDPSEKGAVADFDDKIKNISELIGDIFECDLGSVDFNASAWKAFAREVSLLCFDEDDFAIDSGVNREVAAHESARTSNFRCASLADENFTSLDLLATKTLDAKSLAGIVV